VIEERWTAGGLAGTFAGGANAARGPAALLLAGSGPVPRDGAIGTYRLIAAGLADAGIRSFRYDKRGAGASRALAAREDDLVLGTFVDDAVSVIRALGARPDVSAVVAIGHSEGALIATLAAAKIPLVGIVLLAGAGRRIHIVLREQLLAMPFAPEQEELRARALQILQALAAGERVADVPPQLAALFRPSVQPFLQSWDAFDPAAALAKLSLPVLIVRGARDIQISRADVEALARARPDARVLELPEANHEFRPAPEDLSDRVAQLKSYDPAAPLVPGLVPALVDFIRAAAR